MTSYRLAELSFTKARPFFPPDEMDFAPQLHASGVAAL